MAFTLHQILSDRYRIERAVGDGPFGNLYQALDLEWKRPVAVKQLRPFLIRQPEQLQHLVQPLKDAGKLNPSVFPPVHHVGALDGSYFVVREFINGKPLAAPAPDAEPASVQKQFRLLIRALDALALLHAQGLAHTDLKPSNVWLADDRLILTDFGMAAPPLITGAYLTSRAALGALEFAAPEQVERDQADARSDVYAIGALLYWIATGTSIYALRESGLSDAAARESAREGISVYLSQGVALVASRALAENPDERYKDAGAMRDALARALGQVRQPPPPPYVPLAVLTAVVAPPVSESLPPPPITYIHEQVNTPPTEELPEPIAVEQIEAIPPATPQDLVESPAQEFDAPSATEFDGSSTQELAEPTTEELGATAVVVFAEPATEELVEVSAEAIGEPLQPERADAPVWWFTASIADEVLEQPATESQEFSEPTLTRLEDPLLQERIDSTASENVTSGTLEPDDLHALEDAPVTAETGEKSKWDFVEPTAVAAVASAEPQVAELPAPPFDDAELPMSESTAPQFPELGELSPWQHAETQLPRLSDAPAADLNAPQSAQANESPVASYPYYDAGMNQPDRYAPPPRARMQPGDVSDWARIIGVILILGVVLVIALVLVPRFLEGFQTP